MGDVLSEGLEGARRREAADPVASRRDAFHLPCGADGAPKIYLCGNSLGLQPRATRAAVEAELDAWARLGVDGHFAPGVDWFAYHERVAVTGAAVVGADPGEVVAMNALSVNLHLLLISFYRPQGARRKIVIEAGAFPSDRYIVASQARLHGLEPEDAVVELAPRPGEHALREEDIEAFLEREGDEVATLLLGGVHYYTGQALDMARITQAGRRAGAVVGFDLAHAAGNLELRLHDWGVDFAAWCSYKYLNAGPGGVGMAFVHARHAQRPELQRLAGWWGNDPAARFQMPRGFEPQPGAAGWQLSNAPVLPIAALAASLDLFHEVGMAALRARSLRLTGYLLEVLDALGPEQVEIITPREPARRGAQLSLRVLGGGVQTLHDRLDAAGVVCDLRKPDVVRVAPAPLYNTYEEVWRFAALLSASAAS